MPSYNVTIDLQCVTYTVEAESEDEALNEARAKFESEVREYRFYGPHIDTMEVIGTN